MICNAIVIGGDGGGGSGGVDRWRREFVWLDKTAIHKSG